MVFLAWFGQVLAADLPLESIAYTVEVTGPLANVTVEQTFRNNTDETIEATYRFPLQPDAAVDRMRFVVGKRVIEGEILEREEAKQVYEDAKAAGQAAALTEQERANIFTQHVANIGPGETIQVILGVVQPVPRKDRAYELVLPLVVGPRFVPDGVPDAERITGPIVTPGGADPADTTLAKASPIPVDIDVDVRTAMPIAGAESPSHPIDLAIDAAGLGASVTDARADRDFILRWWAATDTPKAAMLVSGEHALLSFEPPRTSNYEARVPRELVWILDTSCSMGGAPIDLAKAAVTHALEDMDPADSFSLVAFSNTPTSVFPKPVPATPANVQAAKDAVDRMRADGGTYMVPAVQAALALPHDPKRHRILCLLSDGFIGNDDEMLGAITAHPEVTFASVGIGVAPNRYLMDELAALGGGVAAYANPFESAEDAMDRLLDAMDRPVLTDVKVDWGDWQVESAYPSRVPDLHVGTPTLVAAHMTGGSGPVRVSGHLGSGTFSQVVTPVSVDQARPMVTTWARQRVADIHRRHLRSEIPDEKPDILAVGLQWHILTDYTAFVAVDEDAPIVDRRAPARPTVDTERVSNGTTYSAQFLSRVPSGRSYQSVVGATAGVIGSGGNPSSAGASTNENTFLLDGIDVTDPVVGTFSLNFDYEGVHDPTDAPGAPPSLGGPLLAEPGGGPSAGNRLKMSASVGSSFVADGVGGDVGARVGGPLSRDALWAGADLGFDTASFGGLSAHTTAFDTQLVGQPTRQHQVRLRAQGDSTLAGEASTYGGAVGTLDWLAFPSSGVQFDTWASAGHRTVRGDARDGLEVGATTRIDDVRFLGMHRVEAGVAADRTGWRGEEREGDTTLATAYVGDRWLPVQNVVVGLRGAAGVVAAYAVRPLGSPSFYLAWDPWADERTWLTLSGSRAWETGVLPVGVLDADGLLPRTDTLRLDVRREIAAKIVLSLDGTLQDEHLPFVPAADLVEVDDAASPPWVDRVVWSFGAGVARPLANRVSAELKYRFTVPPATEEALLTNPASFWVPGFLDASRRHAVDGTVLWQLPTDPWTLTLGAAGAWADAVGGEGWWLGSRSRVGVQLLQDIPWKRGKIVLDLRATWAVRDPGAALLPLAVLATEPGAPALDTQPPFQVSGGVRWEFF